MNVAMEEAADLYYCGEKFAAIAGTPLEEDLHHVKEDMVWKSYNDYTLAGTPPDESLKLSFAGEVDRGVILINLLIAAVESLSGDQTSHELSKVVLARLKELLPPTPSASGIERLAAHFANALNRLLAGDALKQNFSGAERMVFTAASQLLQDTSPHVSFGHFTANQAIVEAVGGERRVHIVDFDIMEGAQWAPLMQAFMSRKDGPPPSHVKITAVRTGEKSASAAVKETGRMLAAFAASIGLPFSFAQCRLDRDRCFRPAALKVLRGEAIVFNCALHAPHPKHHSAASIRSFLASAAELRAKLVTVVEEDGAAMAAGAKGGFLAWFMKELKWYLMMWDALEEGFSRQSLAREIVENAVFAPRIAGAVEEAFSRRDEEGIECWSEWMLEAKFRRVAISSFNQWHAKLLLGLFNDGYRVEEDGPNKLALCWKSGWLVSASVWSPED